MVGRAATGRAGAARGAGDACGAAVEIAGVGRRATGVAGAAVFRSPESPRPNASICAPIFWFSLTMFPLTTPCVPGNGALSRRDACSPAARTSKPTRCA
jgi:hypothetical protein